MLSFRYRPSLYQALRLAAYFPALVEVVCALGPFPRIRREERSVS
jgi:hypothetical protein